MKFYKHLKNTKINKVFYLNYKQLKFLFKIELFDPFVYLIVLFLIFVVVL